MKPAGSLVRTAIAAALAAVLPFAAALAAGSPIPELRPAARPHADPPMRILRVTSSDPACQPNCPEWISADGVITRGSAAAFANVVESLAGRRLPVLISSHGGSVQDAVEMGVLIREQGPGGRGGQDADRQLPRAAPACDNPRGEAIVAGATCASACPLILAGGVERLVGPVPLVGVHQITTILKQSEGIERLTRTVKVYE